MIFNTKTQTIHVNNCFTNITLLYISFAISFLFIFLKFIFDEFPLLIIFILISRLIYFSLYFNVFPIIFEKP